MKIYSLEIILYVSDQQRSRDFYAAVLEIAPSLDVPGMTEFILGNNVKLGLMPEKGIAKLLGNNTPHPETGNGIPRCELYLLTNDSETAIQRAVLQGAKEISPAGDRDWGDRVGYVADVDGHVIAFAQRM